MMTRVPERPDSDREVLTNLPRSRPARRSAKRGERTAPDAAAGASPEPAAPRKPRAAKAAAKSPAKPQPQSARARPSRETVPPAERPVRPRVPPERKIPAAGYAAPDGRAGERSASPAAELVSTSIQATAELAQIGLTVGRQTLRSMLERLPKP